MPELVLSDCWRSNSSEHSSTSRWTTLVQGLIDFLVSRHKVAVQLREKLIFKIFPMMNPDGVFLGNYKGSLFGED